MLGCIWTWITDHATVLSAVITAIATGFIAWFTVNLVRTSVSQGKLTERALVETRRAFVFAGGLYPEWFFDVALQQYTWRFRPVWVNSGETATKNLQVSVDCEFRSSELPVGFDITRQRFPAGKGGLIGPKYTTMGGAAPHAPDPQITAQDILDIRAGKRFLYLYGWARYNDVFPETEIHISRFCWQIVSTGDPLTFDPDIPKDPSVLNFSFFQHSEGNCTDGECVAQAIG